MKNLKKQWFNKTLVVLLLIFFSMSCSGDDSSDIDNITAQDLVETFDENPSIGDKISTLDATGGQSALSYNIVSQQPFGALTLNSVTGELAVADDKLFDFEVNPIITAVIKISDSQQTVYITATIALNNLDDIEHILAISKTGYINASDGDWIQITETEYNSLAAKIHNISHVGTTRSEYNDVTNIKGSGLETVGLVYANVTSAIIPNKGYVFAFKYHAFNVSDVTNSKIKQSSVSIAESYSNLGKNLPKHSGTNEDICFVLKGSNSPTTDDGYLAFYNDINASMGYVDTGEYYIAVGDVNFLNKGAASFKFLYQGLSTTQKQW